LQARKRRHSEAVRRQKAFKRQVQASVRRERKKADLKLKSYLKAVRDKGIYEPKSLDLTKYRKSRIRKVVKEFGDLLVPSKFIFVEAPKPQRAKVRERAKGLGLKATRTGVFIEREGFRKATLKVDKKSGELFIERKGKVKRGPTRGKRYTRRMPLASIDELDKQRERIRQMARDIGPLKENERLAFRIIETGNDGYSHATFSDVELLLRYLENYRRQIAGKWTRSLPAFIHLHAILEVEKTESSVRWQTSHPPRDARERLARLRQSKRDRIKGR